MICEEKPFFSQIFVCPEIKYHLNLLPVKSNRNVAFSIPFKMKIAIIIIASLAVAAVAMPKKETVANSPDKVLEDKPLKKDEAENLKKTTKPIKDTFEPEDKPKRIPEPDTFNGKVGPVTTVDNDFTGSRALRSLVSADLENQRFTVRTSSGNLVNLANTQ